MTHLLRVLAVGLLGVLLIGPGAVANAHDELVGSDPEAGETVTAPQTLTLEYSGQIAEIGALVELIGPDGDQVPTELVVEGTEVIVSWSEDLADGEHGVAWRVTSSDGHPISGEFSFTVAADESAADEAATEDEAATDDATDEATAEATEDAAATQDAAPIEPEGGASEPATTDEPTAPGQDPESDGAGMPWWTWAAVAVGVGLLAVLLARTWSRRS